LAQFADELFKQLSKIPLLSSKEEHYLWARCKEGQEFEARQELIERYQPLVCKIITSLKPAEQVYLDLFQEGVVGLVEAVERFEPDRGFKFSTYATFRIRGRALTYLQKQSKKPQNMSENDQFALILQNLVDELDDDPDEYVQNSFLLEKIYESIEELPEKERRAFEKVILKEEIPKEVAREMRISRSYLSRLLKRAWKRLKVDLLALRREVAEY
jgi:RNA polymerase sigma factor (sigma-70 family)